MKDLFDQIKDNLENRPAPAFEARYWERLENGLDQKEQPKAAGFGWWWLLPIALLLASNIYLYFQLQKSNTTSSGNSAQLTDTVYLNRVIYQRDTIIKTTLIKEQIQQYIAPSSSLFDAADFAVRSTKSFKSIISPIVQNPYSASALPNEQTLKFGLRSEDSKSPVRWTTAEYLPQIQFNALRSPWPIGDVNTSTLVNEKKRKSFVQHLNTARPTGLSLGFGAGLARPLNEGLYDKNGYIAGLEANVEFNSGLRLWLNADYINIKFETDRMDEAIGVPVISPPTDDFIFEAAEVPQHSIQYSAGLQYYFNHQKNLRPYIGLGMGAVSVLPYEVTYEFDNIVTDLEWNFEERVRNERLISDFLLFHVGIEYQLSPQWAWQIRSGYRTNINNVGFQSPRLFNLQTGLRFKIK